MGKEKGSGWSKQGPQETHTPTKIVPSFSERKPQHTTTATFDAWHEAWVSPVHLFMLNREMGELGPRQTEARGLISYRNIKNRVAWLQEAEAAPSLVTSGAGIRA